MDTDRDLLLALLALRVDLISAEQLTELCLRACTQRQATLADLLVERGGLTAADRSHLEPLAERVVQQHGGDPRAAIGSLADATARRALANIHDTGFQQYLAGVLPGPLLLDPPEGRRMLLGSLGLVIVLLLLVAGACGLVLLVREGTVTARQRELALMARMEAERAAAVAAEQRARAAVEQARAQMSVRQAEEAGGKPTPQRLAEAYRQLGELLQASGRAEEAEQAFQRARELQP